MKTKIHFILGLCVAFFLQAQGQNGECDQKVAGINALVNETKLAEALDLWEKAGNCQTFSEAAIRDGEKILNYKIENTSAETQKLAAVSSLVALYDAYDKMFPANKNSNLVKKAQLLNKFKPTGDEEAYKLLDRAFHSDLANFNDAAALYLYLQLSVAKHKLDPDKFTQDDVFSRYDAISLKLAALLKTHTSEKETIESVVDGSKALIAPLATCENLAVYYEKQFDAGKADTVWLERAAKTLAWKKCVASPIFLKIAATSYALNPTANSAYHLGTASMKNRDQKKAEVYFGQAAELETDPTEKAQIYYTMASASILDKAKALDYVKKSIAAKPSFGKAYLLMARIYSESTDCGKTPFEKKAIYFLAAQTVRKAAVDPAVKGIVDKLAASYLAKAPTIAEIKLEKKGGKKVGFSCYINDSVIIPE